jgi:uncharacterized SAM-binding protein YcdF (DUF218 family)
MTSRVRSDPGHAATDLLGCRILGALALALLAVVELTPATSRLALWYAEPARLEPAEAIVALGGGLERDGWLDSSSWRRLVHGVVLFRQGLAPLLVLTGSTPTAGPTETEVRARIARELGVPPEAILPITGANTTREEALRVRAELQSRGVRSILLVTGPLHLVRARAVFEREGFIVRPAPIGDLSLYSDKPGLRLALTAAFAQELLGRLYYRLAGYL